MAASDNKKIPNGPIHAVITGTVIEHGIPMGEYFVFKVPVSSQEIAEALAYFRDREDEERLLVNSWAEINGEEPIWHPCGLEVRLVAGRKSSLLSQKHLLALDALPPAFWIQFADESVTSDFVAKGINTLAAISRIRPVGQKLQALFDMSTSPHQLDCSMLS